LTETRLPNCAAGENEITLFLLRVEKQIYYVIENTLNIYKINKLFLVTSCESWWV